MANGRALVDPPPFTPLNSGLLTTALDRSAGAPAHWSAGITWQSHCPGGDGTYDPCLTVVRDDGDPTTPSAEPPADPPVKEATTEFFLRGATPFAVFARFDCSPVGFYERASELASQALVRVESHQVERVFDTGVAPDVGGSDETVFPHLRADEAFVDDTGATLQTIAEPISATPYDLPEGIARLEAALASCYHGQGVLHVPTVLGAKLAAETLVTQRGGVLTTLVGNRVSLGSGYTGLSPSGVDTADVTWIYATGAVFYYRSEIQVTNVTDAFNRGTNTVEAIAERRYVIGWDCCHLAVPVYIGTSDDGGT